MNKPLVTRPVWNPALLLIGVADKNCKSMAARRIVTDLTALAKDFRNAGGKVYHLLDGSDGQRWGETGSALAPAAGDSMAFTDNTTIPLNKSHVVANTTPWGGSRGNIIDGANNSTLGQVLTEQKHGAIYVAGFRTDKMVKTILVSGLNSNFNMQLLGDLTGAGLPDATREAVQELKKTHSDHVTDAATMMAKVSPAR